LIEDVPEELPPSAPPSRQSKKVAEDTNPYSSEERNS
jgi:hypothetical protein